METTAVKVYSLDYNDSKTYLFAGLFILGNLALPQVCHLLPQGGIGVVTDLLFYPDRGL